MSADTSKAMEALKELLKYSWSSESLSETDRNVFLLFHKIIRHALLKAAETETELAELKAKVKKYFEEHDNWVDCIEDGYPQTLELKQYELQQLCEVKE